MLNAGFGRTDITPELGVRLGGYGIEERPAEEIFDRLHSTAMVIEQDEVATVIINLDWACIEEDLVERIRTGINQRTDIPKENITICASHSHSVPNTLNFWGWGERENDYVNSVLPEIIQSVELARKDLQEVKIGFAATRSLVGVNRRGVTADGNVSLNANEHGPFDPTMTVMHCQNASGCSGILVHYGAHGTAMGINRLVSRDWMGVMKDRIESQFKAPVVFLNGAIGDVGPRTNFCVGNGNLSAGTGDGIHAVREVGYRAATDAIRALISIKDWHSDLDLQILTRDIVLPYAPLTSVEDAEREVKKWTPRKDEWGAPMCEYLHNKAVLEAHSQPVQKERIFQHSIISLGPMAIVPMPGEIFADISLRIRQLSPFQHTLCCSLANGNFSYLTTREARHRGGYETWVGRAIGPYLLADNIDDVLVEQNAELLAELGNF